MTFGLKNVRAIRDKWMEMHGFQFYDLRRIRESQSYRQMKRMVIDHQD